VLLIFTHLGSWIQQQKRGVGKIFVVLPFLLLQISQTCRLIGTFGTGTETFEPIAKEIVL
jgi:hypothetical protein